MFGQRGTTLRKVDGDPLIQRCKAAFTRSNEAAVLKQARKTDAELQALVVPDDTPELERFEKSYMELEKPLISNLTGTRKVIQLTAAIMTHYDERVFKNAKKHEFALRSVTLDVMRQLTEADLAKPEFQALLMHSDSFSSQLEVG
jgi:flagellar FliL protein